MKQYLKFRNSYKVVFLSFSITFIVVVFYLFTELHSEKEPVKGIGIVLKRVEYKIDNMTCGSCVDRVEKAIDTLDGILKSDVSFKKGNAVVEYDGNKTSKVSIEESIKSSGFTISNVLEN